METVKASDINNEALQRRIDSILLFREVRSNNAQQYQLLLEKYSQVHFYEPGEVVLSPGETGRWLYFVVRGELEVVTGAGGDRLLGELAAGEVFGDLALLTGKPRAVYVKVAKDARPATVLAVDFERLGDLDHHAEIQLDTKIFAYRQLVHSLRWRNDQYRIKFPDHPMTNAPYQEPPFTGRYGSLEELHSLAQRGQSLAERLVLMNRELGALTPPQK